MRTIAFLLQIICLILVSVGIIIELEYEADLGFVLITTASVLFALSTKLNKWSIIRENKLLKERSLQNEKIRIMDIGKNGVQATFEKVSSESH